PSSLSSGWRNDGPALGPDRLVLSHTQWYGEVKPWAPDTLIIHRGGNEMYRLSMTSPLQREWMFHNPVPLSDDQLLFQTRDQLLILDMPTKRLGFLTMGRGPVVIIPNSLTSQPVGRI